MKTIFIGLLLVTIALANKQKPQSSCPVVSGDWLQQFSINMMDPQCKYLVILVWLMVVGFCLLIVFHVVTAFFCIKKRNRRNKIKDEMKIKQMMFSEFLV